MDDVFKVDESVEFYTGLPSMACLTMIFILLKPFAEKKYVLGQKQRKGS